VLKKLEKFSKGKDLQDALQCNVSRRMAGSSPMLLLLPMMIMIKSLTGGWMGRKKVKTDSSQFGALRKLLTRGKGKSQGSSLNSMLQETKNV